MPEAKRIRAVLLWLDHPVLMHSDDDNGPEWFKDPARNILVLHLFDSPTNVNSCLPLSDLPEDKRLWSIEDLYRYMRAQNLPLDEEEVLFVTDKDGKIEFYYGTGIGRMPLVQIRGLVTIDRIVREIYRIEHERQRKANEQ